MSSDRRRIDENWRKEWDCDEKTRGISNLRRAAEGRGRSRAAADFARAVRRALHGGANSGAASGRYCQDFAPFIDFEARPDCFARAARPVYSVLDPSGSRAAGGGDGWRGSDRFGLLPFGFETGNVVFHRTGARCWNPGFSSLLGMECSRLKPGLQQKRRLCFTAAAAGHKMTSPSWFTASRPFRKVREFFCSCSFRRMLVEL